jgi:hypothetical protein
MNGYNELRQYGIEQAFGVEAERANREMITTVKNIFQDDGAGWDILNSVLNELFVKLDALDSSRSTAFRMFSILRGNPEYTKKANDLTLSIFNLFSAHENWKFKGATIENSVLTIKE